MPEVLATVVVVRDPCGVCAGDVDVECPDCSGLGDTVAGLPCQTCGGVGRTTPANAVCTCACGPDE